MKKYIYTLCLWLFMGSLSAQVPSSVVLPEGKFIYIPKDLQSLDLQNPESKWSYHRMACTENFVIFWEKGFGNDLSNPPQLEGKPMAINLPNLKQKLERFYSYFRDTLKFVKPGSKSEKYRMMVMLNYSLEGTAYGGDYDQQIGALWVAPNRIQDKQLNCVAHELGHSFQAQISCDGEGKSWGGSGFFEMASQWMLWQVNPEWITDEKYHWDAFSKLTHKAYLHLENIYHSPFVLEYWGLKHGLPLIAELFRQGKVGEDPVMTYKQLTGLSQEAFCDEMFDACRHFINWDFERVHRETRPYTNQYTTKLETNEDGWQRVSKENCPENYGFNAIPLDVPQPGKMVKVEFIGTSGVEGYNAIRVEEAGWRYGFVGITQSGKSVYGTIGKEQKGSIRFVAPKGEPLAYLWLVVMGAPKEHWVNPGGWDKPKAPDAQWPYQIRVTGSRYNPDTHKVTFIVASDPHFTGDNTVYALNRTMVEDMNRIKKTKAPWNNRTIAPEFVWMLGDMTENGGENQWAQYEELYGLHGDGVLRYPVYECFGNHDGDVDGVVRSQIRKRNQKRKVHTDRLGLHYSWDVEGVHFVNLNLYPADVWSPDCDWCKYFKSSFREAQQSLHFLKQDLKANVRSPKTPVVIAFHLGFDDFSLKWWIEKDREDFYQVIKDYHVIALFHGHNHGAAKTSWKGIDVWSVGSPRHDHKTGEYLVVEIDKGKKVSVHKRELDKWTMDLSDKSD